MVVHTQTDRVHDAQHAVVEFLLINHPLDCPVCDKGGECPLQDITYGWGPGTSRFIEPKRHFKKPLELSPLVAIDRERCILCYRCVRFSQEVSEDYQLVLLERGAHTYVGTFDGHPYVAPFSGNIIELCPVGALTSTRLPLPRAPVGHRGRRLGLHAAARRSATSSFTVRDDRVHARARARQRGGRRRLAVRQGPLRATSTIHVDERITAAAGARGRRAACRRRGRRRSTRAAQRAQEGAARKAAALAGGETTNEEAFLLAAAVPRGARLAATSPRAPAASCRSTSARALADPGAAGDGPRPRVRRTPCCVLDCDPVDDAPILDLRIRKGVRRHNVHGSPSPARARPRSTRNADAVRALRARRRRGAAVALDAALAGDEGDLGGAADRAGANADRARPRRAADGAARTS